MQLGSEYCNLDKQLDNSIIAIADLGLWNGRKWGFKILSDNLNSILESFGCNEFEIFCGRYDVEFTGGHHDGTHYVTFREIKEGVNIDNLLNKIYNGNFTKRDITRYTKSLKPYVKEIYGF